MRSTVSVALLFFAATAPAATVEVQVRGAAVQAPDRRTIAVQVTQLDPGGERKAQVLVPRRTYGALGDGAVGTALAHRQAQQAQS